MPKHHALPNLREFASMHNNSCVPACISVCFVLSCIVAASFGQSPATRRTASSAAASRVAVFQPGVVINWHARQVELEAEVILREGPLELFACSGGAKAHESILMLKARPLHVFQAIGLLGIRKGGPGWWDEKTNIYHPPTGGAVDIRVQWNEKGRTQTVFAYEWLEDLRTQTPMQPIHWVFSGSQTLDDGSFGGDLYGTVVTLVDFGTSVLSVIPPKLATRPVEDSSAPSSRPSGGMDEQHATTEMDLALIPLTERIPKLGTRVTLIIREKADNSVKGR